MSGEQKRPDRVAVVLAAGRGTRLRSELPKVLHPVGGRPMLCWVLDAAAAAGCSRRIVIVGHGADRVIAAIDDEGVEWVEQTEQLGTGHALAQAAAVVPGDEMLIVLSGDVPLVTAETLQRLADSADASWGAMAVAQMERPGSLGRVVAGADGALDRIVEAADASPDELAIDRVNAGIYALPAAETFELLTRLRPDNAKGELYLTDALTAAVGVGRRVELAELARLEEALGVNDRADLARAHGAMEARLAARLMAAGVTLLDPGSLAIEGGVDVAADTVVHAGVTLLGETRVGARCTLHRGVWLRDVEVGDDVEIFPFSVAEGSRIAEGCRVGPFARLRPGTKLGRGGKVGNFVEVKNSELGTGAKVGHLTYVGDAEVGDGVNIGAGVVTCNYDGERKHRTKLGDHSFIGSDTMLVAPVEVGERAVTGAGSVITRDVPADSLGVARSRQRIIEGWTERRGGGDDDRSETKKTSRE